LLIIALPAAVGRVERANSEPVRRPKVGRAAWAALADAVTSENSPWRRIFNFAGYQAGCATVAHFIGHEIDFVSEEKVFIS
jgi:hypothetical protein